MMLNVNSPRLKDAYISVKDRQMPANILFKNTTFTGCKATFGGPFYVYSKHAESLIDIISCQFIENKGSSTPSKAGDVIFGRASIFMTIKTGNVMNCKFYKNLWQAVKVYNKFD